MRLKIDIHWLGGMTISMILHLLLVYLWEKRVQTNDLEVSTALNKRILVDLEPYPDDLVKNHSPIIANQNLMGRGKIRLTPKEKQHLRGEVNPRVYHTGENTDQKSSELKKKQFQKIVDTKKKKKSFLYEEKINLQASSPTSIRLGIETENSFDDHFWFKQDDYLQIKTERPDHFPFMFEMMNILKQQSQRYLNSRSHFNHYYVKRDEVSVMASIDRDGYFNFKKILKEAQQPYLVYLAKQIVDRPQDQITALPSGLMAQGEDELDFVFSIRFSGEPLRQWWMGFYFIK